MAADQPSSAWHPALMPNHDAPASTANDSSQAKESPPGSPDSLHNGTPLEPEPGHFDLDATLVSENDQSFTGEADNEHEHEHVQGGAWLPSEQTATSSQPNDTPSATTNEKTSSATNAQHSSSMSFARTVSHELNFHDDEDSDWNLSRSNTDPFKFMGPSDRSNSFPEVPPITPSHGGNSSALNQTVDLLEDPENLSDSENPHQPQETSSDAPAKESGLPRTRHRPSHSIGGNVQGFQGEVADARYEEGLPLLSAEQGSDAPASPSKPAVADEASNFFGDNDGNDDDFFASTASEAQTQAVDTEQTIRPLERKSTSQVLQGFESEPLSPRKTMDTTLEEEESGDKPANSGEMDAKWQEAFGDDDEDGGFLLDNSGNGTEEVDPAAFLGSDDEGLLEDDEEEETQPPTVSQAPPIQPPSRQASFSNPYAPQNARGFSTAPAVTSSPFYSQPGSSTNFAPQQHAQVPAAQPVPEPTKAQSFADKSKGGYSSPYDLPSDIATSVPKSRRRPSAQSSRSPSIGSQPPPPPSRSASMNSPAPPPAGSHPPSTPSQKPMTPLSRSNSSFFEELPMTSKPRSSSRQSMRTESPAPPMSPPKGPPMSTPPLGQHPSLAPAAPLHPSEPTPQPSGIANLVAPEKTNPYASLQHPSQAAPPPANQASRYSPAPAHSAHMAGVPPAVGSRYSPAPPVPRQVSGYSPTRVVSGASPALTHLPRTSSPLAHFETSTEGGHIRERRLSSSSYEPRLNRMPSLPPTREVDEEDDQSVAGVSLGINQEPRNSSVPPTSRQTPPPSASRAGSATLSPPRHSSSNYVPGAAHPGFVPPPRPSTQSPGGVSFAPMPEAASRPPMHSASESKRTTAVHSHNRARGTSLNMIMVPPTDGRELDQLQRWKGAPIISWGVGGTVVTSFPKSIPRYAMGSSTPTVSRVPGEVKVRSVKAVEPLSDRIAKFPGPLKGKSKKKETIAWLTSGIEELEKELPSVPFHTELSFEAKRQIEKILLWKILRVFIEHDGALEGNPAVEKAVREVLSPSITASSSVNGVSYSPDKGLGLSTGPSPPMRADGADSATMDQIRESLLKGDKENAVWAAVDKRMWGHAMLIANTVSSELCKRVAQEFVRNEVNQGHNNESLATLYMILSGNHDDCVDEMVPSHARAGLSLMSTTDAGPVKDTISGLDKWQETLALVLSNRSADDIRGLHALGKLLAGYGRIEAAHICFIFSRAVSVFGGADDPASNIVLIGSEQRQHNSYFVKDSESIQLTEVYEYGMSLAVAGAGAPHLASYKFHQALSLAEYGYRDKALQYCDSLLAAISSNAKRSPYYTMALGALVEEFMTRLSQVPKEESSSWISKPNMNSVWHTFNQFVTGDKVDANGTNISSENEKSPFARIATTPTISRSPSMTNFENFGAGAPGYMPNLPAASNYAPVAIPPAGSGNPYEPSSQYAPAATPSMGSANPYEPTSQYAPAATPSIGTTNPYNASSQYAPTPLIGSGNSYDPSSQNTRATSGSGQYPGYLGASEQAGHAGAAPPQGSPYVPASSSFQSYQPTSYGESQNTSSEPFSPTSQISNTGFYQPLGISQPATIPSFSSATVSDAPSAGNSYAPTSFGYEPPQTNASTASPQENGNTQNTEESASGGYEPPSFQPYGYEPPSYQPDEDPSAGAETDDSKPKRRNFMDDDDDDIPALKADKSKADKDRENEEMFRKAAEEDAKREAEQKAAKKGWGLTSWFGAGKRAESPKPGDLNSKETKYVRAKLGEQSTFVYDTELKRWVNKKPGAENVEAKKATPPPPRGAPRSATSTPPPGTPPPPMGSPHSGPPPRSVSTPGPTPDFRTESGDSLAPALKSPPRPSSAAPPSGLSASTLPARPATSMSNASSIDDLIGAAAPRKPGQKKTRKSGRYVDVMAKE
ncbi:unnamed protein product [Clonostachys rhizophaga]|uniref:Protein transport protein sec16 n=1 Tax=Clonostachys rhizophaga TaxID=160324 RepID=A0A9N9V3S0_9HYPO|nr:unnamed protein product [Clonostachys rhizophaga]